jgi:hypothetical protein
MNSTIRQQAASHRKCEMWREKMRFLNKVQRQDNSQGERGRKAHNLQ